MKKRVGKPARVEPTFFDTPPAFRRWLQKNHASASELWVGFRKKATGKPSITWPESVDQALCFGWIDGIRKSIDADSYMIRFTPRRAGSIWSVVNTKRAGELIEQGRMQPAGAAAFARRDAAKTKHYSFEGENAELGAAYEKQFRANRKAWEFFQTLPPSNRKAVTWWVMSAKQESTRQKRLAFLIAEAAAGRRLGQMQRDKSAGG